MNEEEKIDAEARDELFVLCFGEAIAKLGVVVIARAGVVHSWVAPVVAEVTPLGIRVTADRAALPGAPQRMYDLRDGWRVL